MSKKRKKHTKRKKRKYTKEMIKGEYEEQEKEKERLNEEVQ